MIQIDNLTYTYPGASIPAVKGLNLKIENGESLVVMGANGSGKSTFAKILAGLLKAQTGYFKLDVDSRHPIPVGILFQNPENQMVAVTVEKELAFALENLSMPLVEMEKKVGEVLERFGIEHLRNRLTSELSGGERQRVALASIMVFDPPVLVLDEPDSYLDEAGREVLRRELKRIHHSCPDLIEVRITQYPQVAQPYERMLVFENSRLTVDGLPHAVFSNEEFCRGAGISLAPLGNTELAVPGLTNGDVTAGQMAIKRIVTKDLSYCYGTKAPIFRKLNFELKRGETLALVGPSGSGKSTLAHLLCGLLLPRTGEIRYEDEHGASIPRRNLLGRVSGIFQQPERQFFLPSCREEIAFGPANLGRTLDQKTSDVFFHLVGLKAEQFAERDPFSLSGGEKRRLAFAAVLSMAPEMVLFDEPTCALDMEGVGRFIRLGRILKANHVGIGLVSHDGDIIKALADRILLLPGDGSHRILMPEQFFGNPDLASFVSPVTLGNSDLLQ
mgnify:CR=1 FL=1